MVSLVYVRTKDREAMMNPFVVFLVVLLNSLSVLPTSESRTKCPQNWRTLNNSCIQVSNIPLSNSWKDAKTKCGNGTKQGRQLVIIEDTYKYNHVMNILDNQTNATFYIGLSVNNDSQFEWIDGKLYNYSNWMFANETSPSKNTCAVYSTADSKWMLDSCDEKRRFICQRDFNPSYPGATPPTKKATSHSPKTDATTGTKGQPANKTKAKDALNAALKDFSKEIKSNMTSGEILTFVKKIEKLGKNITDGMKKTAGNITEPKVVQVENENMVIEVALVPPNGNFRVKFPKENSQLGGNIILPISVIAFAQKFENNSDGVGITSVFLPGLGKSKGVLISGVISTKVDAPSGAMQNLTDPVVISLPHGKKLQEDEKPTCAFIDESTSSWSTAGCRVVSFNSTFTVSHCSHLTSFALLLDVDGTHMEIPEKHKFVLMIVSIVGCCIAIVCFVAALIAFYLIVSERRRRKTETIAIHKNLAIAEIFALTFFLLAYVVVGSKPVCFTMALLLHYFLMAVFFWMLIEGLNLHRGLVQVFVTSSRMKCYKVIGWVTPLPFVACTAAVGGMDYVRDDFCWISHQYIWVFAGPVAVILFINLIIMCIAIRVMIKRPNYKMNKIEDSNNSNVQQELRIAFKTTVILLPLLGLTWCLGFLVTNSTTGNVIIQYMFAVINSLQGLYFFFAHCVYDEDVIRTTSSASTRIKSYFSRTLSNSGRSGSASVSNSKRTSAYCNASYNDGRECKTPCHLNSEMNRKKGFIDAKDLSASATCKTNIVVNGNQPNGTVDGDHKEDTKHNGSYPVPSIPRSTSKEGFHAYFGFELEPSPENPKKTTADSEDLGTPNQQFFQRARSVMVKLSSNNDLPVRRTNSLTESHGTWKPLSKHTSSDSNQSGNSNTPILFSGR